VDFLALGVLVLVGVRLVEAARSSVTAHRKAIVVVRGLELRHFTAAIPILLMIVLLALALIQVPLLSFGWWQAIGGVGNPAVGITEQDLGALGVVISAFFIGLLVVALPLLVAREEWVFRRGAERRGPTANLSRAVLFGLAHAVIGIPIGAALALSVGGIYLTACYLRGWSETRSQPGALLESTRAHLAYNLTALTLIGAIALAFGV
jgi:hypothetical protein